MQFEFCVARAFDFEAENLVSGCAQRCPRRSDIFRCPIAFDQRGILRRHAPAKAGRAIRDQVDFKDVVHSRIDGLAIVGLIENQIRFGIGIVLGSWPICRIIVPNRRSGTRICARQTYSTQKPRREGE